MVLNEKDRTRNMIITTAVENGGYSVDDVAKRFKVSRKYVRQVLANQKALQTRIDNKHKPMFKIQYRAFNNPLLPEALKSLIYRDISFSEKIDELHFL